MMNSEQYVTLIMKQLQHTQMTLQLNLFLYQILLYLIVRDEIF